MNSHQNQSDFMLAEPISQKNFDQNMQSIVRELSNYNTNRDAQM